MKKISSFLIGITSLISCSLALSSCNDSMQEICNHSYSKTSSVANCYSGGYALYTCSLCADTYTEYEEALGHDLIKADCINAKHCSRCDYSIGNPLGHTTANGFCSRCDQMVETKIWEKAFYVDEFQEYTDQAYIRNVDMIVGAFSNSATTNSKLYARILIDAEDIAIKLWEYGSQEVNAYSTTDYKITILDDYGNKHYTTGTMYQNGERIYLDKELFISLLQQNEKLKIYIIENSKYGYNSTYLFEVERGNFDNVFSDFNNKSTIV